MADLTLYQESFDLKDLKSVIGKFQNSLVDTNRSYLFFVDWGKVKRNIDHIKTELALLDSLIGAKELKKEFIKLLQEYPEVIRILPLLIAIHDTDISIIDDFENKNESVIKYIFNHKKYDKISAQEALRYFELIEKTGAVELFSTIKNFKDYILGVEVGMDTNARKNRSGSAMELLLAPIMEKAKIKYGLSLYSQKQFKYVEEQTGIKFPELITNKKFDFLFVKGEKVLNIEVNYFDGAGSKQEIINSYIQRQSLLKNIGGSFMMITDGRGWSNGNNNERESGFAALDYVINLSLVRDGFFEKILFKIFK